MVKSPGFRGVFAVLPTPFTPGGSVDFESLRRCVRFCIDAGAHGLVAPVNASEFTLLTSAERQAVVEAVVQEASHRIPVVVGASAETTGEAVDFASHARAVEADAVMAMAPYRVASPWSDVRDHFVRIADTFAGPVFIQSYHAYPASQLPVPLIAEIVTREPGIWYVKEETYPAGQRMTELMDLAGDALAGVMGGMASRYILDEHARGACGTMPACEVVDVHVRLWEALAEGRLQEARAIHDRLLPLLNFEQLYGPLAYKEVLVRRGIIAYPGSREGNGRHLDQYDHAELDRTLANLASLLPSSLVER